ncbi:uncharacterized protein TRIADDRAFT_56633 [Trichoplax adhaerens]|uniref:Uncharacterized protein n=1 Tax=Trichoplax adhaerens TaxID=10228 RepID=B3RYP8_TRIAD|nr:hypothetical protein TRIADDRAFT_56633 [Trichoplax adhaerens]EDV25081.1 hypothetical protein TRIADDRAFT_56633 [Trichoplax adhaerens]|eukprot:XP_002112971.1 hypothetical protein TRIADDRAFT_56633 [Trichoplax adhaerens]
MGIGHFKFATDESKRQEQFQQLNNLREQTLDQRTKRQHLKEKRKAALDARLAKVKLRKGISDAFDEEVSKDNDSDDSKKMQDEETAATISPAVRVELHDNRKSMEQQSELQNDTKTDTSKKVKKYDPSQERLAEFAPPAEYFENSPVNQRRHQQSFKKPSFAFNSYNHTWNWQPYPSVIGAPPPIPPTDTGFQYKCHDTDLNRSNLDPRTSKQRAYTVPVTSVETSNADNYSTTTINEKDIQNLISFYRNSTD